MMEWLQVVIVFSVLILVHEFGHFWMARRVGVRVEIFSFGFGPKLFSLKRGNTEYRISAILFGGYVKMAGDEPAEDRKNQPWEFLSQPVGNRFKILLAGPLVNYLLGFLLFSFIFYIGYPTFTTEIGGLVEGYPAAASGLRAGDKIIAVDRKSVRYWEETTEIIHKKTEGTLTLTVDRDGSKITVTLTPQVKSVKDPFGRETKIGLIGISHSDKIEYVKHGIFSCFKLGFERLMMITSLTYKGLWMMVTGQISIKESAVGPIGIVNLMLSAAKIGIIPLLQLSAIISASLAIFNLLPIPILDAGHIMFLMVEKIRGKPLSRKTQEVAAQAGLAFLLALMFFVSYNDILRIFRK